MMTATPFYYREYFDQTTLHPLGLAATIVLSVWTLVGRRRDVIIPMMIMMCFMAPAQRIAIGTIDMTLLRLLVLAGAIRVAMRGEWIPVRWGVMDAVVLGWCVSGTVVYTLLWQDVSSFVNQAGARIFDAFLTFALIRSVVRGWEDVERAVTVIAVLSVPVAIAFTIEQATGRNLFAFFGGVPEFTMIRNGRLRCQGAFPHPILAGVFWASLLPMIAGLWSCAPRLRLIAAVGGVCCLVIIGMCASSTPVSALILAGAAWLLFPLRRSMRAIRWGMAGLVVLLHFVREMPVWHLVSRLDFVGGSTGYHRYLLMDEFIRQTDKWWLIGMKGQLHEWLFDITNQYVYEGMFGGMSTLVLLLLVIGTGFRLVGVVLRAHEHESGRHIMAWALGVALFVHVTSFVAVSYFGQIKVLLAFHLACVATLAERTRRSADPGGKLIDGLLLPGPVGRLGPSSPAEECRPLQSSHAGGAARPAIGGLV